MKKVFLLLFTLSTMLFVNCSGGDDEQQSSGYLEVGSLQTNILDGVAQDYGQDFGDGFSFNIDLTFLNYTFDELESSSSVPNDVLGIYFEAYSPVRNRLAPGVYDFIFTGEEYTFSSAYILYANEDVEIVSGTLEVFESDFDYYEVFFEGVDIDGNSIYFEYTDTVFYEDNIGFRSSRKSSIFKNKKVKS